MLKPIHVIICVALIIVSFTALNQFKEEIVVAIIDTEFNRDIVKKHEIWTNTGELPNNHVDDDKNGYIDDYYG